MVYDESDGFWPAYSAAEALAQRGWQVTFATALTALAPRVPHESVGPLLRRLGDAGVTMHVATRLVVPEDATVSLVLRPVFGGSDLELGPALVVWHQPRIGDDELVRGTSPSDDAHRHRRLRDPPADRPRDRRGLPARGVRLMRDHPTHQRKRLTT